MELKELELDKREKLGSSAVARMRREGVIPAVVYSEGKEARSVSLTSRTYSHVVSGSAPTQLYKLKSTDSELDGKMALIKEVQHEPLKDRVLHLDFLSVSAGHRITLTIPIVLTGEAAAVKLGEMILNQTLYELEIECLPTEIPDSVVVDISGLREGVTIHARDIALPPGVELKSDEGQTVVGLIAKAEEEVVTPVAAAAAAPTAEGAAAATPGAAAPAAEKGAAEKGAGEKGKDKK